MPPAEQTGLNSARCQTIEGWLLVLTAQTDAQVQEDLRGALLDSRQQDSEECEATTQRLSNTMQEIDVDNDGGISLNELIVFGLGKTHEDGAALTEGDSGCDQICIEPWDWNSACAGRDQISQILEDLAVHLTAQLDSGATVDAVQTPRSNWVNECF